jgi:membrane protein implicated in regulation of membrane protease activity
MIWFLVGFGLCILEAIVPTAYVALVGGIAAILVGFTVGIVNAFSGQVILWLVLTALGILLSRPLVKSPAAMHKFDAASGETLTEIPPNGLGRVQYEGQSWAAKLEDPQQSLAATMPVVVIGRDGTTLIVAPRPS